MQDQDPPGPAQEAAAAVDPGERLARAAGRGDAEAVLRAGCEIALADPLRRTMSARQIARAILRCRAAAAPALAFVLREIAARSGDPRGGLTMHLLYRTPRGAPCVKVMSAMAEAGFEVSPERYVPARPAYLRAHAAHLQRTDPGADRLERLLARPQTRPFHGRSYGRFPGDLSLWQPFVLGHWGVPWAFLPAALVVLIAAAALGLLAVVA